MFLRMLWKHSWQRLIPFVEVAYTKWNDICTKIVDESRNAGWKLAINGTWNPYVESEKKSCHFFIEGNKYPLSS